MEITSDGEASVYDGAHRESPPENHIRTLKDSTKKLAKIDHPDFGLDSLFGLACSNVAAPLYLYASLKGKFLVWDDVLEGIPDANLYGPSLDVGCGRGLVLLKVAQRKKQLLQNVSSCLPSTVSPAYGIDIFNTSDQTGNSPAATFNNAVAMDVVEQTVLHTASFVEKLPFANDTFSLITSSLALHNVDKEGRRAAILEMTRVCAPGGKIAIIDLYGGFKDYLTVLQDHGLENVSVSMAGMKMMFGAWPCQILTATKPSNPT